MLTLFCHSRTFKIGMGLIEALAKIFFSSIPVRWRRMRKTNSVLCICGGCGLWITLSYGGKAKIPSQIEIEKSILGQTAQLIPNQFRGRILSGHPVQGFEQNGLWRFKLRETNLKKAMAYLCWKKPKTALSLRSWKNSKYLRQLTFKTVKGSRCS